MTFIVHVDVRTKITALLKVINNNFTDLTFDICETFCKESKESRRLG